MILTKTPLRISLGGGGTDLPVWYKNHGSFLISMTINKYIYVTATKRKYDNRIWLSYSHNEIVQNISKIKNEYLKACIKKIKKPGGLEIHTISDVPGSSGLGSSGAFLVGVNSALMKLYNIKYNKKYLAELSCEIEMDELKKDCGKQDQYSSVYGGINSININTKGKVRINNIKINEEILKKFNNNIKIYFSGQYRDSNKVLSDQKEKLRKKNYQVLMSEIQEIGKESYKSLIKGDLNNFAKLLNKHQKIKNNLSKYMTNNYLNQLFDFGLESGATGCKNIGAGGGGLFMFYVPKKNHTNFANEMKRKKLVELKWKFEKKGNRTILANSI